nr:MAG TPA: hypothetical protein [Caudoviricetes sp.]
MFAHIGKCPLAPVGAAQTFVLVGFLPTFFVAYEGVQVGALGVEVILPAGIGGVVHQKALVVLGGGLDAVFQLAGVEGDVAVNEPRGFLRKGELGLLQGSGLFCAEVGTPAQLHPDAVHLIFQAAGLVKNGLGHEVSAPFHMKMRQRDAPVVRDIRHRTADVHFFEGGVFGLRQAADSAAEELAAPLERPVRGFFCRGQTRPLGIGQIARRRREADMHHPLGVAGGRGAARLPPAAPRENLADRLVGFGGRVVQQHDDRDGRLHQKHPRYSRPCESLPSVLARMACASAASRSASALEVKVMDTPSLETLDTPGGVQALCTAFAASMIWMQASASASAQPSHAAAWPSARPKVIRSMSRDARAAKGAKAASSSVPPVAAYWS